MISINVILLIYSIFRFVAVHHFCAKKSGVLPIMQESDHSTKSLLPRNFFLLIHWLCQRYLENTAIQKKKWHHQLLQYQQKIILVFITRENTENEKYHCPGRAGENLCDGSCVWVAEQVDRGQGSVDYHRDYKDHNKHHLLDRNMR